MVILYRKLYSSMAHNLKIIYCNSTPLSHQDSDWDPSTFREQEIPQQILRKKKSCFEITSSFCLNPLTFVEFPCTLKFRDLSRFLGKARIWWGYGFSEAGKKLLKKLLFFWWRKSIGYDSVLSNEEVRPMVGQSLCMRAGSFVCAFIFKENGLWKDSPCHWGAVSPSRTQQVLNAIWKHHSRWCRKGARAQAQDKPSVGPADQPSNHAHISRPEKPFLKTTSKAIPAVGRAVTGPRTDMLPLLCMMLREASLIKSSVKELLSSLSCNRLR